MRISEDRYTRDLRRLHLARRFIQHEVRTGWICAWTGLSGSRVRNLFHSYLKGSRRRRGRPRGSKFAFLTSPDLRDEASAACGLASVMGVVGHDAQPAQRGRGSYSLECGERLCDAFELYREVIPDGRLTLDQLMLLIKMLTREDELAIGHCVECHGSLIVDRLGTARRLCLACKEQHHRSAASPPPDVSTADLHRFSSFAVQLPLGL